MKTFSQYISGKQGLEDGLKEAGDAALNQPARLRDPKNQEQQANWRKEQELLAAKPIKDPLALSFKATGHGKFTNKSQDFYNLALTSFRGLQARQPQLKKQLELIIRGIRQTLLSQQVPKGPAQTVAKDWQNVSRNPDGDKDSKSPTNSAGARPPQQHLEFLQRVLNKLEAKPDWLPNVGRFLAQWLQYNDDRRPDSPVPATIEFVRDLVHEGTSPRHIKAFLEGFLKKYQPITLTQTSGPATTPGEIMSRQAFSVQSK